MKFQAKVMIVGNSVGITIPSAIAKAHEIDVGTEVLVEIIKTK